MPAAHRVRHITTALLSAQFGALMNEMPKNAYARKSLSSITSTECRNSTHTFHSAGYACGDSQLEGTTWLVRGRTDLKIIPFTEFDADLASDPALNMRVSILVQPAVPLEQRDNPFSFALLSQQPA